MGQRGAGQPFAAEHAANLCDPLFTLHGCHVADRGAIGDGFGHHEVVVRAGGHLG